MTAFIRVNLSEQADIDKVHKNKSAKISGTLLLCLTVQSMGYITLSCYLKMICNEENK